MTETEQWFEMIKHMAPWDVELRAYAAVGDLNSFFGSTGSLTGITNFIVPA